MHELFSCRNCERNSSNGGRTLDGVVMNGTAMGILGKLPKFERRSREMNPVKPVAKRQYFMCNAKFRHFVDAILVASSTSRNRSEFPVRLKLTL